MAGASLLTLLDKIAVGLDDVAVMTKVAAKKTAGVLGDDLALNAQQVSGVNAERELPVVWAVAKGSALNKLILVPAALLISAFLSWLITPLLMVGGAYLCFEGADKIVHSFAGKSADNKHRVSENEKSTKALNIHDYEQEKIKGAVRTDFILSAEIIVIALGTVQTSSLMNQVIVVTLIAAIMTVGVYGLVAAIVKLDDAGLYLLKDQQQYENSIQISILVKMRFFVGRLLLNFAPKLMRSLAVIGTIAMFLVGGSILMHGIAPLNDLLTQLLDVIALSGIAVGFLHTITPLIFELVTGLLTGLAVLIVVKIVSWLLAKN